MVCRKACHSPQLKYLQIFYYTARNGADCCNAKSDLTRVWKSLSAFFFQNYEKLTRLGDVCMLMKYPIQINIFIQIKLLEHGLQKVSTLPICG